MTIELRTRPKAPEISQTFPLVTGKVMKNIQPKPQRRSGLPDRLDAAAGAGAGAASAAASGSKTR